MTGQLILPGVDARVTKTGIRFPKKRLTFEQWKEFGVALATIDSGISWAIGDWYEYGKGSYGERADMAVTIAEAGGFKSATVQQYGSVAAAYQFVDRSINLSFKHHLVTMSAPPHARLNWLQTAEENGWTAAELRKQIRASLLTAESFPEGKYAVLYADPPWAFANSGFNQSAESAYPTMETVDISNLTDGSRPVADLAAERAALFLWVPASLLPAGCEIVEAWGFSYKSCRVWLKDRAPGMGWYLRTKHELLLLATRGESVFPKEELDSCFDGSVSVHSKKPEAVYDDIERMYDGPYVELFARNKRDGWASWGNEIR